MLAGLSLITSHTKAYAQSQTNCPMASSNRNGVVNGPIVCDGEKGVLNTSGGGSKIEIKMDMSKHSGKEAVKITGPGTNITIMKSLKVKVTKWSGKGSVIKVEKGGELTLKGEVDVEGVVGTGKVIEVDGGMVVLGEGVGKIEGKGSGEVMLVNNGGTLMMMGKSAITIKGSGGKGVYMGSTEKLVMMRNVTFEGVTEGININGGRRSGAANVMGMGLGMELGGTTMTVKNSGSGVVGIKVEDTGTINATVMGLKIVGDRSGGSKGVEFIGTGGSKGTLMLNMVEIEGFETGVEATAGTLKMMGGAITVKENGGKGYGLNMQGEANAELMRTRIVGGGSNSTGVVMESEGVLMLNMVNISDVKMGVSASNGKLVMMGGTAITVKENGTGLEVKGEANATMMGGWITVTSGGTGLSVSGKADATLMGGTKIKGTDGKGYGVIMEGGTVKMDMVGISGFEKGVEVTNGTVTMMGTTITVKGDGKGTGYGVGVGVSGGVVTMMGGWIMGSGTGKGTGVYVGSGGEMVMTSVRISGFEKGVSVSKGKLVMNMGSITIKEGAGNYGVGVWGKATATLMGTAITVKGDGKGTGYGVKMMGGTVEMTSVDVSGVKMGVYVGGGTLKMNMGKIEFTSGVGNGYGVGVGVSGGSAELMRTEIVGKGGGTGVYMGSEGVLKMDGVGIEGVKTGVSVEKGKLVMKGGWIKGMGGKGVVMGSGTVTMMERVWISNVEKGVEAMGTGTLKMMGNSTIIFTGDYGVKVGGTATAHLTDVMIRGMGGQGTGKYGVIMEGGTVTMNMVGISDVAMGVHAKSGKLVMNMGKIEFTSGAGNGYGVGVGVSGMASVELMRTEIVGDGKGGRVRG
ncbi:hypothetical protein [Bartonella bovis]|uniref:Right handed beta helix domain-containing protein n=1 Tax=Bartonella bovis m02 TaxID=1094492 RepID=N6VBD7_9HYPH|nr:hypothetical protein [Bartonella bovis]ENN91110.1 hypothetical protein m02_10400 [Bartonella bovis m02]